MWRIKEFTLNDSALTSGRIPYATTNGRLTDSANFTNNGTTMFVGTGGAYWTSTGELNVPALVPIRLGGEAFAVLNNPGNNIQIGTTANYDLKFLAGPLSFNGTQIRLYMDRSTGNTGFNIGASPTAYVDIAPGTTASASLRLRSGTAPTTPNDGDIWFDGTDLKMRVSGTTKTFTLT